MKNIILISSVTAVSLGLVGCATVEKQQPERASSGTVASAPKRTSHAPVGYTDTPMLPGGKWHVHDPDRPQPKVVAPGTFSTPETPGKPPSDAVVLFGGTDLSRWRAEKGDRKSVV